MQRRIRGEHPHERVARREGGGQPRVVTPGGQDNGPFDREQQRALRGREVGDRHRTREVPDHHRERLLVALLTAAEALHGGLRCGIARELKAADALDRHDEPLAHREGGIGDRIRARPALAVGLAEIEARAARGACIRLRVEAAVRHAVVLALACRAHREAGHRRPRTVVRRGAHDGEARAAVRAVRERIVVAPIRHVVNLGEALGADREIWRDRDAPVRDHDARHDREVVGVFERDGLRVHAIDNGRRGPGGVVSQPLDKRIERARRAEGFDRHARGVIPHAPGHRCGLRHAVDPRPEAHALHGALHPDAASGKRRAYPTVAVVEMENAHEYRFRWQAGCHERGARNGGKTPIGGEFAGPLPDCR